METVLFLAVLAVGIALWPLWGRRGPWQALAFSIVLAGVAGVTALTILGQPSASERETPTETAGPSSESPSPVISPTVTLAPPDPPETPAEQFVRYEVGVDDGQYRLFIVDAGGTITGSRPTSFSGQSHAPVDRVESPNGLIHWRTILGGLAGWSYIAGDSGPFKIREVYRSSSGELLYREVQQTGQ